MNTFGSFTISLLAGSCFMAIVFHRLCVNRNECLKCTYSFEGHRPEVCPECGTKPRPLPKPWPSPKWYTARPWHQPVAAILLGATLIASTIWFIDDTYDASGMQFVPVFVRHYNYEEPLPSAIDQPQRSIQLTYPAILGPRQPCELDPTLPADITIDLGGNNIHTRRFFNPPTAEELSTWLKTLDLVDELNTFAEQRRANDRSADALAKRLAFRAQDALGNPLMPGKTTTVLTPVESTDHNTHHPLASALCTTAMHEHPLQKPHWFNTTSAIVAAVLSLILFVLYRRSGPRRNIT